MLQILRKNFGLKLFSFALALAGWAFFRFLAGPSLTSPFSEHIGVPVTVNALPTAAAEAGCPCK